MSKRYDISGDDEGYCKLQIWQFPFYFTNKLEISSRFVIYLDFSTKNFSLTIAGFKLFAIFFLFTNSWNFTKICHISNISISFHFRSSDDNTLSEVTDVLQEWTEVWHELYLLRDHGKFTQLKKLMEQLSDLRRQYTLSHLTYQQKQELRLKIVDKIHLGTKLLDLDLVAREIDGQGVDTKMTSAVHVYNRVRKKTMIVTFFVKMKQYKVRKSKKFTAIS